jgi:hypothetical protein
MKQQQKKKYNKIARKTKRRVKKLSTNKTKFKLRKTVKHHGGALGIDQIASYAEKKGRGALSVAQKNTLVEYIILLGQYAIYSIAGFLLYAPAYAINVPNNTLENLLPTGSCKFFFNDKTICQSQLKCLLGLCGEDSDEDKVILNGGKKVKNKRLVKKILEQKEPSITITQVKSGGKMSNRIGDMYQRGKNRIDQAKADVKDKVNDIYERGQINMQKATAEAKQSFQSASDAKAKGDYGKMGIEGMKGVGKGVVDSIGVAAHEGVNIADSIVKTGIASVSPIANKINSASAKMAKKRESPDNVNEECKNHTSHTFCHFGKNYKYGNKHQPKENGILKDIFVGKTDEKIMEIGIDNAKNIATSLQQHMINENSGLLSIEKTKKVLSKNMGPGLMRNILKLMHMLELIFPDSKPVSAKFEDKPKNINVVFPWTVYGENAGIRDKVKCMWKHLTKSELSESDWQDDLDENSNHRCFYCKKCTLQNTAFRTIRRFITASDNENSMEYILQNLYDLLLKYFDVVKMPPKQHNTCALLVSNIMHRDIDINKLLNYPHDSYKKSKNQPQNDLSLAQSDNLNLPFHNLIPDVEYGTDLVKINNEYFNIRNILTGVEELKRNNRSTSELNIDSLETTYQALKKLDIVNIVTNIILQQDYNVYFEKHPNYANLDPNEKIKMRKSEIHKHFISRSQGSVAEKITEEEVFLDIDYDSVRKENIVKLFEDSMNGKPNELIKTNDGLVKPFS